MCEMESLNLMDQKHVMSGKIFIFRAHQVATNFFLRFFSLLLESGRRPTEARKKTVREIEEDEEEGEGD